MAYNNDRRDNRRNRDEGNELTEKVVSLNRVSKTVKGGRVMKFSALCVVGDGKGRVGYGLGKASEVSEAIRKGLEDAKKHIVTITMQGTTIPHEVMGEFGAGRVYMMPAPEGTGVLAGGAVRAVMEAAGIRNIRAKCLRSNNPQNVVAATMAGPHEPQERRAGRRRPRQDRRRSHRLRRYLKWLISRLSSSRASTGATTSTSPPPTLSDCASPATRPCSPTTPRPAAR